MNNLSSYCGLVDAKIRACDKDLPVPELVKKVYNLTTNRRRNLLDFQIFLTIAELSIIIVKYGMTSTKISLDQKTYPIA